MRMPGKLSMAAGAVAASTLPWVAATSPAGALEGDEVASTAWDVSFTAGSERVTCSVVGSAEVLADESAGGFIARAEIRVDDTDPECQETHMIVSVRYTDVAGNPQKANSEAYGTHHLRIDTQNNVHD